MKKSVIKGSIFLFTFLVSLFIIGKIMNKGNTDITMEMKPPTYPLVYMNVEGERINCLHGYETDMEVSYQRETLTPVSEDRKLSLEIEKYENEIEKVSIQVRNLNGSRLIEDTQISDLQEQDGKLIAQITLKDLIQKNKEYSVTILVTIKDKQPLRFYTKILYGADYYVKEKLEFAKDFHNKTFQKENAKEIARYLESNTKGDNSSFHKVDIHSSFAQITWGDLEVKQTGELQIAIKEISSQNASFEFNYFVEIPNGKNTKQYRIKEYYRIRYGSDRMYLLDYERTMSQIFLAERRPFANNKIELGIASADIRMTESDGGAVVAFVHENSLYSYNAADHKFITLFSFYNGENLDARMMFLQNNIKILSVDETGNIRFMVYGYMNRGMHEGNLGVQIYYYNGTLNTLEEEVFIPDTKSYEVLEINIEQLSYISKDNSLYIMLAGNVYRIDLLNHNYQIIVSNVLEESFKVSKSGKMLAWQEGNQPSNTNKLILMNFNTKKRVTIEADRGEHLKPLGFMEEDLIYGTAYDKDVIEDKTGSTIFPMYIVKIENENGEILKEYKQDGIYVESCEIEDNQIILKRLQKSEDGITYLPIEDDQIVNNNVEQITVNTVETVTVAVYEKMVQIAVKANIPVKKIKYLNPKEVLYEGERELVLTNKEEEIDKYYVYGKNGIEGSYTEANNAIDLAEQIGGSVVNKEGAYVWIKGDRALRNQIMAITPQMADADKGSVAVCLDTILKYEGMLKNTEYMLSQGESVLSILENNLIDAQILDLTGRTLDSVLYYTNRDIPVIALLKDGNAVLIVGFNELNTVIMDPVSGTIYKMGKNDSAKWFEENGNMFISYITKED